MPALKSFFLTLLLASCLSHGSSAVAQEQTPTCSGAGFEDFDFWIGHWTVHTMDGALAGENLITRQENNCLILEHWTSTTGTTGQSYNFYNPVSERWRQIWISDGSIIDLEGGLTDGGAMHLEGEIIYTKTGKTYPFTGLWTPLPDGSVRQEFEQFDPESEFWGDWFTGIYTRKAQ